MSKLYPVPEGFESQINSEQYDFTYEYSIVSNDEFWASQAAKLITWFRRWDNVRIGDFQHLSDGGAPIRWYDGGKLNACYNCVDRHVENGHGDEIAIIFEDDNGDSAKITYAELLDRVCRFANVLLSRGVRKGDRVAIYMPMTSDAAVAMLACARIGAVHSVVFGGFSPEALKDRILDSDCRVVITSNFGMRGGKKVRLKDNVDKALEECPNVHTVLMFMPYLEFDFEMMDEPDNRRDLYADDMMEFATPICPCEEMDAEDPLFILYTSGSTGKPKGVLHTTGGYMVYAAATHKYVFDYNPGDIYWCTADVGWVTGHTYIVYGPLANRATTLMFAGVPNYPDGSRFWEVVDKHQVNIFYTAPTAIRALIALGDEYVTKTDRSSLRVLGTVGEPINPEVWEWYHNVVGNGNCPVIDTWWQTETGGILIAPLPGATDLKPGSATKPLFGIVPGLMDAEGKEIVGPGKGNLVIKHPWPGQMRTVYGDHERFIQTYFSTYPGLYFTGDGATLDEDGYWWVTGRVDDVINVSGHRMGTAEVESALVLHTQVSEAAVVGYPHEIKGAGIYAYVTPMKGVEGNEELRKELVALVREEIGPIASPDMIQWAPGLPKTRSGKIMRRILRKVAANELDNLGDTSTLADPTVVDNIIENRLNK